VTETLMVESSALAAIILEEPGWRQLAEQIVRTSAFTTCFNVFEAALAVVRERQLKPSEAYGIVLDAAARRSRSGTMGQTQFLLPSWGERNSAPADAGSTWAIVCRMERRKETAPAFSMSARTSLALTSTTAPELDSRLCRGCCRRRYRTRPTHTRQRPARSHCRSQFQSR